MRSRMGQSHVARSASLTMASLAMAILAMTSLVMASRAGPLPPKYMAKKGRGGVWSVSSDILVAGGSRRNVLPTGARSLSLKPKSFPVIKIRFCVLCSLTRWTRVL